jgi:hypothetical protein
MMDTFMWIVVGIALVILAVVIYALCKISAMMDDEEGHR